MRNVRVVDKLAVWREDLNSDAFWPYKLIFDALHVRPGADHFAVVAANPEVNDEPPVGGLIGDLNRVTVVQKAIGSEVVRVSIESDHRLRRGVTALPWPKWLGRELPQSRLAHLHHLPMHLFGVIVQPMLELKATSCEYELADESGYKFKITAKEHQEGGWYADVTFSASRFKTAEAAVMHLKPAAEHFIRMLKETYDAQP